ncbi:MAG: hypothetical protein ACI4J7_09050 [Ruminiclostridium sp.]
MDEFIKLLEFVFRDFWTWLGTLLLVYVIANVPRNLINICCKKYNYKKEDKDDRGD